MAACSVLLCLSYSASNAQVSATGSLDPTQVYTTGNIVQPTVSGSGTTPWVNGVYQDNLTCWAWGMPGNCGPNPTVRPGGNINFSFGMTDLYQAQAIANVLPNAGSGLRVNGYNFGFTAKNGNGWDNGQQDYLYAYVNFSDAAGKSAFYKSYDLNSRFNWTTFNYSETFTTPFASKDLSTVRYGFVGMDTNYWAGPYGPEIYNVNFSLKYSVDPCSVNILSSPSCPGYSDYVSKLSSPTAVTSDPVITTLSSGTQVTATGVNTAPATTSTSSPTLTLTTADVSQPVTSTATTTTTTATSTSVTATAATTTVTPSATNPQPKVGEISVAGSQATSSKSSSTVSTSQILSIVSSEQSRLSKLETATAAAAVEQAKSDATKAANDAVTVATTQQTTSTANAQAAMTSTMPGQLQTSTSTTTSSQVVAFSGLNQGSSQTSVVNIGALRGPESSSNSSSAFSSGPSIASMSLVANYSLKNDQDLNKSRSQETTTTETKQLFSALNPLNNSINSPLSMAPPPAAPTGSVVNQKVKDNDAAGGISIASIAKQPQGFEMYMAGMTDRPFYPPKEIYKGQRNVDNARAQRLLSGASDRLHQQMVDQQYNLGN